MKKLLIIAPHLSTGGLPQYLLKQVQMILYDDQYEIKVIEYENLSDEYIVQKHRLKNMLNNYNVITLGDDKTEILERIEQYDPDVIHMAEIPELFMDDKIAKQIYGNNRTYKLIETSHTLKFDTRKKKYFPDKFMMVTWQQIEQYERFKIPIVVTEYPIEMQKDLDVRKRNAREKLSLRDDSIHVLSVGLFAPWKNQKYIIEIARKLPMYSFDIVGNLAPNFEYYWKPIIDDMPENVRIWGEQDDMDQFYAMADMFLFPSLDECNPIVLKEAVGYKLPVLTFGESTYAKQYDKAHNIYFLCGNVEHDVDFMHRVLSADETLSTAVDMANDLALTYSITQKQFKNIRKPEVTEEIFIDFVNGARVEIKSYDRNRNYRIFFVNSNDTRDYDIKHIKGKNNVAFIDRPYYTNWSISIEKDLMKQLYEHTFNATGKKVYIALDSKALGDTIAWIPYVEQFRQEHDCEVICSTYWNTLLADTYDVIEFVEPDTPMDGLYAMYTIGVDKGKTDWRSISLQQVASEILGLDHKEIRPDLYISEYKLSKKYVCIGEHSTAQAKHWNNPTGWQDTVDYLKSLGYDVVSMSLKQTKLKGVIHFDEHDIVKVAECIKGCDFFVGLSSGLSWLAWALGKEVVMISGMTDPSFEFQENNLRVFTAKKKCRGCFNDINEERFDKGNWNWCPRNKIKKMELFECTKSIKSIEVIEQIEKLL